MESECQPAVWPDSGARAREEMTLKYITHLIPYDADRQTRVARRSVATLGTASTGDATGAPDRGGRDESLDPGWGAIRPR